MTASLLGLIKYSRWVISCLLVYWAYTETQSVALVLFMLWVTLINQTQDGIIRGVMETLALLTGAKDGGD